MEGQEMYNVFGVQFSTKLFRSMDKYDNQAEEAIKKAEDIIVRSDTMQRMAALDGESDWCLKLVKKEKDNDCKPSG